MAFDKLLLADRSLPSAIAWAVVFSVGRSTLYFILWHQAELASFYSLSLHLLELQSTISTSTHLPTFLAASPELPFSFPIYGNLSMAVPSEK